MAVQSLAVKYRPKIWSDVCEQSCIRVILEEQLQTQTFKNSYLFCGPAGCGKTTCARIFANEINNGKGNPIEMDAASNSGVDDVRNIAQQAKTKSLDSEYKVFIIDECHAISNTGWQAFLKLIEEPPAKSIFIFCTTDPQKIPKTILSRVQRYDFRRISQKGIVDRLNYIIAVENSITPQNIHIDTPDAIEYISKLSEGGMRDAITMMDKCLSLSKDLTLENVVKALGVIDYDIMLKLTDALIDMKPKEVIEIIEGLYAQGKDLKRFVKSYTYFLLDVEKFVVGCDFELLQIPALQEYKEWFEGLGDYEFNFCKALLGKMIGLNADIKYSQYPKADIEAVLILISAEEVE